MTGAPKNVRGHLNSAETTADTPGGSTKAGNTLRSHFSDETIDRRHIESFAEVFIRKKQVIPSRFTLPQYKNTVFYLYAYAQSNFNENCKNRFRRESFHDCCVEARRIVVCRNKRVNVEYVALKHDSDLIYETEEKIVANKEEVVKHNILQFRNLFDHGDYNDRERLLEFVVNHIMHHYKNVILASTGSEFGQYFSTLCHMLQSSGYGKSRLAIELGGKIPVIYTSFKTERGYPCQSFLLQMFLDRCKTKYSLPEVISGETTHSSDEAAAFIFAYFMRLFFIILESPLAKSENSTKALNCDDCVLSYFTNQSVDIRKVFHSIYDEVKKVDLSSFKLSEGEPIMLPTEYKNFTWCFEGRRILSTENIEEDTKKSIDDFKKRLFGDNHITCPLIFVLDEAQALLYSDASDEERLELFFKYDSTIESVMAFNMFRRVFRHFLFMWDQCWPMLLSTNGKISNFLVEYDKDKSRKPAESFKIIPPIELVQTFDVNLGLISNSFPDLWHEYLKSPKRFVNLYKVGRPLIYNSFLAYYKSDEVVDDQFLNRPFTHCPELQFLRDKIFLDTTFIQSEKTDATDSYSNYQRLSILGLSLAFDAFPQTIDIEKLVSSHMMTLLSYSGAEEVTYGVYPPEGILNGIASWYLVYNLDGIMNFFLVMRGCSFINSGVVGETIAKANLIHAAFSSNAIVTQNPYQQPIRRQINGTVGIETFLLSYTDNPDIVKQFVKKSHLEGALVSFSYFQKWEQDITDLELLLKKCLFRSCALHLKDGYPIIDLLVPMVLKDGRLSFIAIQVKCCQDGLGTNNLASISLQQNLMSYNAIFPAMIFTEEPVPFASLYISLVNPEIPSPKFLDCLITHDNSENPPLLFINGAFSSSMPESHRDCLKNIACSKLPIRKHMNGVGVDDILPKEPLLSCFYEKPLFDLMRRNPKSNAGKIMNIQSINLATLKKNKKRILKGESSLATKVSKKPNGGPL